MTKERKILMYSISKKIIMAVTGLFLLSFLIIHLVGNLLLFIPDDGLTYLQYSKEMVANPLIRTVEIVLVFGFLFHIIDGIYLYFQNRQARGISYAVHNPPPGVNLASRRMMLTGSIIFIFLVVHLRTFFVPYRIVPGEINLYQVVIDSFNNPFYTLFYVIAMVLLGFHLFHGFYSAFRTLGLTNERYVNAIKGSSLILALILAGGFASIPVFFFLFR